MNDKEREVLDLCESARSELKKLIDPRFRLTTFVLDYSTGDIFGYVDYRPSTHGQCSMSRVILDADIVSTMSAGHIVDYLKIQVEAANLDLLESIGG